MPVDRLASNSAMNSSRPAGPLNLFPLNHVHLILSLLSLLSTNVCGFLGSDSANIYNTANYEPAKSLPKAPLSAVTSSWEHGPSVLSKPYVSRLLMNDPSMQQTLLDNLRELDSQIHDHHQETQSNIVSHSILYHKAADPLWTQIKLEAQHTIENEPEAGPQIFTHILSQPSLMHAITSIVSHEIATRLIPATSLQNLFMEMLHPEKDVKAISLDIMASAMRSPSVVDGTALTAVLFNQGLHALICHRLAHRLWLKNRTGLAYYIQSTVSKTYSTDIHPAAQFGNGVYLNAGSAGVVIGETAVIDHDVIILQGVTLGGTGKERGDRHPKVKARAILQQSCSVLGNIEIGEGAIITAKSIVTKPVPEYTKVSGVPAKYESDVERYRTIAVGSGENNGDEEEEEWRNYPETRKKGEEIERLLVKQSMLLISPEELT